MKIFLISISLNLFSEGLNQKQFTEDISYWAKSLHFYSAPHLASNRLPIAFQRVFNSSIKQGEAKKNSTMNFKSAVIQYIEFNNFLRASSKNHLGSTLRLLDKKMSVEETLILASILYESEDIKFVPVIKHALVRLEDQLVDAFRGKHNIPSYEPHIFGYSGTTFDSMPFYIPKSDAITILTRDFWGLNFASDKLLLKRINEYRKVKLPVRQLWVKFNRANVLTTGLPDRERIEEIRKSINSQPKLNQLLSYIVLRQKKANKLESLHGECVAISDKKDSVFKKLGKMSNEERIAILVTEKELLFKLSQASKQDIENFLLGTSFIQDPDLLIPHINCQNSFYRVVSEYIIANKNALWTDEEFVDFIESSKPLPDVFNSVLFKFNNGSNMAESTGTDTLN
jgi:hypothetical protein